ncbi:S8 family peptidase [Rhodopseudomonas sp. HC1]|uniref:S8 family peptidase n=1 Tax=Rhodopseudomonas infernalis TaxID=2897386 RepID=UPI001EE79E4A|nr:S8 family peptidase [Rhodopseudomonas infernalis]MCG6203188.1 S8 family peptidase [Rhodopseudomonas infernalis]
MVDDRMSGKEPWPHSADGRPTQFPLPRDLLETILLGPTDDRRVLQDSPLLGDVWAAYALDPGNLQDVLITPHRAATAASVANLIPDGRDIWDATRNALPLPRPAPRHKTSEYDAIEDTKKEELPSAKIAYLQGLVAAELYFDEVLCILVPLTQWWRLPQVKDRIEQLQSRVPQLVELLLSPSAASGAEDRQTYNDYSSLERYVALAGLIFWIGRLERSADPASEPASPGHQSASRLPPLRAPRTADETVALYRPHVEEIVYDMIELYGLVQRNHERLFEQLRDQDDADAYRDANEEGFIFQISLNRKATTALDRSVPAVKGDAAASLFKVKCNKIVWAVIDSGIDGTHPAFDVDDSGGDPAAVGGTDNARKPESRIVKTFDFTRIREIISSRARDLDPADFTAIAEATGLSSEKVAGYLDEIARDFRDKRPINWAKVEKLITLKNIPEPANPHGTHVAGIIGANGHAFRNAKLRQQALKEADLVQRGLAAAPAAKMKPKAKITSYDGMCPDIRLYDFRVLGKSEGNTEFAVISALQYIRYVNERHNFINVHGVNLSLSIPHDVHNFACGRTPVCNECERLVESGVVVVAAAGNRGFQKYETAHGPVENYAAFSITDPGNSESVITVGSTHGNWPHTYGVSFFSSRGPTGDGRLKPDLVAPGERVQSTVRDKQWAPESGTSMAAPHVSGAAAMLLARYDELVGQPRRVKQILCESATDLRRERSFQGHGMLDVLRALQSI